jgi:hypothetical protein
MVLAVLVFVVVEQDIRKLSKKMGKKWFFIEMDYLIARLNLFTRRLTKRMSLLVIIRERLPYEKYLKVGIF